MAEGKYQPADDDSFVFYRNSARLSDVSTGVHRGTLNPAKLLKNDGKIENKSSTLFAYPIQVARKTKLTQALMARDVSRTDVILDCECNSATHSLDGIDWCSSKRHHYLRHSRNPRSSADSCYGSALFYS